MNIEEILVRSVDRKKFNKFISSKNELVEQMIEKRI